MNQHEAFDAKMRYLESELLNLKTTHFKTATTISTMTNTDTLNFSLMLDSISTNVFSTKRAVVTLTTSDGTDMLSSCYLLNATPTSLDNRTVQIQRLCSQAGIVRFGIAVFSQNANDFDTLSHGGSVNLTYTIQTVGSSVFTTSIQYKNINGGTL